MTEFDDSYEGSFWDCPLCEERNYIFVEGGIGICIYCGGGD